MHILFCRHIWAELSLLFWTFLSGTFFPGGGGVGGGGGARAPSAPPLRTRLGGPGCFKLFQAFPTSSGMEATSFVISGKLFLAFANYYDRSRGYDNIKLPVYKLQENNFTLNQTLDTFSAWSAEHSTIHGEHFLAVAIHTDGNKYDVDSLAYRWEVGWFKEFQQTAQLTSITLLSI